jgi:hypothetical protein
LKRLAAISCALLLGGCGRDNSAPETFLTQAPADTLQGSLHLRLFWTGTDDDGSIEGFEFQLVENSVVGRWTHTTDTQAEYTVNLSDTEWRLSVRAVDNDGKRDPTPAEITPLEASSTP